MQNKYDMRKLNTALSVLLSCLAVSAAAQKPVDYVDPFIGSGGHGHVFVGACLPYGAVQAGPSNYYKGWDWCSGYNYRDSAIIGFTHLHLSGTGIGDLGDVLVMPFTGAPKLDKGIETERFSGYASQYSHANETARPGYYSVLLDDYGIREELTATERTAFHRITYPSGEEAKMVIDLSEGINDSTEDATFEFDGKRTIKGSRASKGWAKKQEVFFAMNSSVPVSSFVIYESGAPVKGRKASGKALKAVVTFKAPASQVLLKVGISPVSSANALANIKAEAPGWDFDAVAAGAGRKWNDELSKITVEGKSEKDKRIFYTSMFHLMIHPSLFNDCNGDFMGADWKVYNDKNADNYTIFSLWDTYRTAHPVFDLIDKERSADFVNSMLRIYDQTGELPIWHLRGYETGTMVGISSIAVITEAYLKGVRGFDVEKAYEAVKASAGSTRLGLKYDRDFKYMPSDSVWSSVARAMEYSLENAGIALMAKALGREDDYEHYTRRSHNYRMYYDAESGFFRGKMSDGSWNPVFDPLKSTRPWIKDYTEGTAWQYLWLAPHDVSGLVSLFGGRDAFADLLDTFFTLDVDNGEVLVDLTGCIGQYAHGNEPSHHIAYLYNYIGQQWKTARLVRRIMDEFYTDRPDGLIGNEDCGQMSAWYIMSSMGLYPVFGPSCEYAVGSPVFDNVKIALPDGGVFEIEVTGNSPDNIYVQGIELNGSPLDICFVPHDSIVDGGKLTIRMGSRPNYKYGRR